MRHLDSSCLPEVKGHRTGHQSPQSLLGRLVPPTPRYPIPQLKQLALLIHILQAWLLPVMLPVVTPQQEPSAGGQILATPSHNSSLLERV